MNKALILLAITVFLISMVSGAPKPDVKRVLEEHEAELFGIEGVSGISVDEGKNEIIVYIERPEISKKVPKVINGFPVRHEVIGRIKALQTTTEDETLITPYPTTTYSRTESNRPVFGGISVGNPYITAGTLGLVTDENYVLSNAHVLALDSNVNFLPPGTPILQPGPYDGGTIADQIGALSGYIPIQFNRIRAKNYADAALATLTAEGYKGWVLNETDNGFYPISGTTEVAKGDTVRKSGRSTGVTTNTVINTNAAVRVYYTPRKWAIFRDQILVRQPFSQGGDSGSAVDMDGQFVGLMFAGSNTVAIVCKATYINQGLGITV